MCAGASGVAQAGAGGRRSTARTSWVAAAPARAAAGHPAARALVLAHCTRARRDPGGAPELLEATGGVVGARGGRDSARPCSTVTHGAAGVSVALGECDGALRATIARVHSVFIILCVNISARVPVYRHRWVVPSTSMKTRRIRVAVVRC